MTRAVRISLVLGALILTGALVWLLFVALPRWASPPPAHDDAAATQVPPQTSTPDEAARSRIKARLFYLTADGLRLQPSEQEVEFGATTAEQARRIVEAQLRPPAEPMVSAVPQGTTLRELFLTEAGDAYVDFSPELSRNHTGGSLDEILTVYTIVGALTENLPGIQRVQILIDGHEVDTLAGHVDLRRPLARTSEWIVQPPPAPSERAEN